MKLSAPIHVLKSQAQLLRKEKSITNAEALDLIAKREGFNSWSLLQSKKEEMFPTSYDGILDFFNPGDIVLIGARTRKRKNCFYNWSVRSSYTKKASEKLLFFFV